MRTRSPSRQALRVLAVLSDSPHTWHHGYSITRATGVAAGTLYPLLMRWADRGYLDSRWEEARPGQRPRHLYRLTGSGRAFATEALAAAPPAAPRPATGPA